MSLPDCFRLQANGFLVEGEDSPAVRAALEDLLPDPNRAFATGRVIKPGSRTHVGLVCLAGQTYFLKRYNRLNLLNRLLYCFRRSRARRSWLVSRKLFAGGLPVPRALLVLERRNMRMVQSCYVLSEAVPEAVRLVELWPQLHLEDKEQIVNLLGQTIGRFHQSGFIHGDLKWPNILFAKGDPLRPCLVDLDGAYATSRFSRVRAEKDLARFVSDLEVAESGQEFVEQFQRVWSGESGG